MFLTVKDLKKSFLLDILKNEYFNNYINKTKIYINKELYILNLKNFNLNFIKIVYK